MISRIIKVSVWVISLSLRLRLITPTSTLIIQDITKTSSNNCLQLDPLWSPVFTRDQAFSLFPESKCRLDTSLPRRRLFLFLKYCVTSQPRTRDRGVMLACVAGGIRTAFATKTKAVARKIPPATQASVMSESGLLRSRYLGCHAMEALRDINVCEGRKRSGNMTL